MAKLYKQIDPSILVSIPNPCREHYEIQTKIPELTFLGVANQPDFATLYITMLPDKKIIELKSLKNYCCHLRDIVVSYERLINVLYDHLTAVYEPKRLRITMVCNPRGGISSKLFVDSLTRQNNDINAPLNREDW